MNKPFPNSGAIGLLDLLHPNKTRGLPLPHPICRRKAVRGKAASAVWLLELLSRDDILDETDALHLAAHDISDLQERMAMATRPCERAELEKLG